MRKTVLFIFSFFCFLCGGLYAAGIAPEELVGPESECTVLDKLICATQNSLEQQKQLRLYIVEYQKIEQECIANPNNPQKLIELARSGSKVYTSIEENGLTDYFKPEFITDLKKLKEINDKKTIPAVK